MIEHDTKPGLLLTILQEYHVGKKSVVKTDELSLILDVEPRDVHRIVHLLRHEGYPICGDGKGYFYAGCPEEIEATARWLMTMGWRIQNTACIMLVSTDLDNNATCALAVMKEAIDTL